MASHELRVEQLEATEFKPGNKIDERDLARITRLREHALAEKCPAEMHAIEAADQLIVLPDLYCVAMPEGKEIGIEAADAAVDPSASPAGTRRGATLDDRVEIIVDPDLEAALSDSASKPSRHMHLVERQDAPPLGLDPIERVVLGAFRHGKDSAGIGLEQHLRRDLDHDVVD